MLALPTNTRLNWNHLQGTNTLPFSVSLSIMKKKCFIILTTVVINITKTFLLVSLNLPECLSLARSLSFTQAALACKLWVRLKQCIRFPLFECLFRRISDLRVTSRRGGLVRRGGCYNMLAECYRERIRCFTLTPNNLAFLVSSSATKKNVL
jgi:hypothetical protein